MADNKVLSVAIGLGAAIFVLLRRRRLQAAPPEGPPPLPLPPPPPSVVTLASATRELWNRAPNEFSPALPPGKQRIVLAGGNQNLWIAMGSRVVLRNPTEAATRPFIVQTKVLVGPQFLREAVQANNLAPLGSGETPPPPYAGPGANTTTVGPVSLPGMSELFLTFTAQVTLDDPFVGEIAARVIVSDVETGGVIWNTVISSGMVSMFLQGTPAAAGAARGFGALRR